DRRERRWLRPAEPAGAEDEGKNETGGEAQAHTVAKDSRGMGRGIDGRFPRPMLNPWSGLRGLSARLWLLATATLINRAGTMVLAFLTLYLTKTQGYTPAQAGAFLALYGGVAIGAAP